METEHEILFGDCCRKLCKTDKMDEYEFEEYTAEHCEDCPIGELEKYHERKLEEFKGDLFVKILKLINTDL